MRNIEYIWYFIFLDKMTQKYFQQSRFWEFYL